MMNNLPKKKDELFFPFYGVINKSSPIDFLACFKLPYHLKQLHLELFSDIHLLKVIKEAFFPVENKNISPELFPFSLLFAICILCLLNNYYILKEENKEYEAGIKFMNELFL